MEQKRRVKMKVFSYIRVSTEKQEFGRQQEAIKKYCQENNIKIDREFSDKISGKTFERKEYQEMKQLVEKDDVIIIKELDRFGRSMDDIKNEWNYFMSKGVRIIVVDMPLISSDLSGKKTLDMKFISNLVFEVLCYCSQKEREKLSQRTKEALAVKKSQGIKLGRPNTYSEELISNAMNDFLNGMKLKDVSKKYNVSIDRLNVWKRERNVYKQKYRIVD